MADPRFYVKPCPPQYLGQYQASVARKSSNARDFFTSAGKIGNLEVLDKVGLGKIGEGLRTLAGISDSVRTGCGSMPSSLGSAIGGILDMTDDAVTSGANWVLEQVGLNLTMKEAVEAFNPDVANQAWGQAKDLYDRIKNGSFDAKDLPDYFQSFQNLERLFRGIYTPPTSGPDGKMTGRCEASPYAVDLVRRHGKYPFLFVVEFHFTSPYAELGNLVFPFVIKQSTRPNVRYQMDDVNFYNFRSKVITQTTFEDMSMTFMDDTQNQAMRFYNAYLRATVPVANIATPVEWAAPEERGMDFVNSVAAINKIGPMPGTQGQIITDYYTGTVSPLAGLHTKTVLSHIQIYHVYNSGHQANIFRFHNPRIVGLNMNDLNMAGGDLNDVTCRFTYEGLYIATDVDLSQDAAGTVIEQERANPIYPMRYNGETRSQQGPNDFGFYAPGTSGAGPDACGNMIDTGVGPYTPNLPGLNIPDASFRPGGGIGGSINNTVSGIINVPKQGLNMVTDMGKSITQSFQSLAKFKW